MRQAGSVCRDLGTSVKHIKNQLCDYMEKSQPDAGIPASGAEILPCNRDCRCPSRFGSPGPNPLANMDPRGTQSASGFGPPSRIWTPSM